MSANAMVEDKPGTRLLTVAETSARLAASERTVWRLIAAGRLRRVHLGRAVRVVAESVERLIEEGGAR